MKRFIAFSIFFAGFQLIAKADHITGGEMSYTYLGKNGSEYQYSVTLKLFMRCNSGRRFNDPATISIFDRVSNNRIKDLSVGLTMQENINLPANSNPCITNPPTVCYDVGYYIFTVSVPENSNGYLLVSQVNYRIAGINNLSPGYGLIGATYTAEIPGTAQAAVQNNSAHFTGTDLVVVCANNSFTYSFAAADADNDRLHYSFCEAYESGTFGTEVPPPAPPYSSVPYGQNFSGSIPLGENVQLNENTGLIQGIAPSAGVYVVTVCVEEIRNGVVIATQRKDLQINVTECSIAAASLLPEYQLCKNTTSISVSNLSNSPLINSYDWQLFNNSGISIYSTTNSSISYNFTDTGLYSIKLYINKGQQCSDSTSALIRVYPGLEAGFNFSGICVNKPTSFLNASNVVYGTIDSWLWNFGDASTLADSSHAKNPVYTYAQTGISNAQLIVSTTKGCRDTAQKAVSILDKPPINLAFKDTLICKGDSLKLHVKGEGNFNWTPLLNINNATSTEPVVYPANTTKYFVQLNDNGCINSDSVQVNVVNSVSLVMNADTVICENDQAFLGATTNGLQFLWTPSLSIIDASQLNAVAQPAITTTYQLTTSIGHCSTKGNMIVKAVPYPKVNAGIDTIICFNTICQLRGDTDGSSFSWSPAATLSDANVLSPIARPQVSTTYVLSAYDTKGCPKPGLDSVIVTVLPKIIPNAGNDTAVVAGQPLQLNASGGVSYSWFPQFNLSTATIADPIAIFNEGADVLRYGVRVYNEAGCVDSAFITIKVFQTPPVVFVPTAFTPNNDGKNDVLRPIAAGIIKIEYFRIYNRWGQLVFSTSTNGKGWDGTIGGKGQGTNTFVWEVKATDYTGKIYTQKGVITLIR
jgi:gliding motility-associated-like protein